MIEITIHEKLVGSDQIDNPALTGLTAQVMLITGTAPESALSLRITTDEEIQQLNKKYLGKDAPTDVLSFPISFEDPETGAPYLGDIVISLPTATRQAESSGHAASEEIKLLLVHGILHLLGYDHTTPEDKSQMWALQNQILTQLDIQAKPTES
ncbi:MAG: rRNA maturation RNase YbeY [Anaerolineales bacterium]|nr:rRNA maturation RNase YbeY [Anaerolineales bacterium]